MATRADRAAPRGGPAAATALAVAAVALAPLVPSALAAHTAAGLIGLAAESLVIVLVLLVVEQRWLRGIAAAVFGGLVVAAIVLAALDVAFLATVDRAFNPAEDVGAIADGLGVVADAVGGPAAAMVAALAVAVCGAGAYGLARAALRVGRATRAQGARGRALVSALTAVWIVAAAAHAEVEPGAPVAASGTGAVLVAASERAISSAHELEAFESALTHDPLADVDRAGLLAALQGKDVVIAFVESYGRVAVEPAGVADPITKTLDDGAASLERAGYSARSAFLSSPTFGGVSWLAHSTLQTGVWVDSPRKYGRLLAGERASLSSLFGAAGWRTAAVVPSNTRDWDEGTAFYGFDTVLDSRSMGYRGPSFGYAAMPDQFTWRVVHDRLLDDSAAPEPEPGPVMVEVDLVSSHTPWTPSPRMVPWSQLGDGAVFASQPAESDPAGEVWADADRVRGAYARSIAYSLEATFSYLETLGGPDLVLVLVGDHQPSRIVSGPDAGPEVPITIIARDRAVLDRIDAWGWNAGVRPSPSAPVWRMDAFRDRFVAAFSD
ncbi:CDP-alcohol phosphatidyltransferase [Microbacterium sp. NPDC057407]|uniref:CDP-alcohol phosphatidyltransferase n=1 Tax=Microbacterium sp. NPDC057407 TaxID=3346120 RepID=UPI00366B5965